jgi:excisionase family DNA binding protein
MSDVLQPKIDRLSREARSVLALRAETRSEPAIEVQSCTVNDTCRLLGVGRTLIYELIGNGELVAIKIGNRTIITYASIKAMVARRASEAIATR